MRWLSSKPQRCIKQPELGDMMAISRRMVLSGAGLVAGALAAPSAQGCTISARVKPIGFSDAKCRSSLRALLELVNAAPTLSAAELSTRAEELNINFDDSVTDRILPDLKLYPVEDADLILGWSLAAGKRDRSPVILHEVNLLKGEKGIALYQFTLRRDAYHAEILEDDDGCGMGPADAFYGAEKEAYLGLFVNNKLREVSVFDAWLRTA